jgi:antitoxin VapB
LGIARLFARRGQTVQLLRRFWLPGDHVPVRRTERGILLEPLTSDVDTWFAELDRFADVPLFENGRNQPPTPS